MQMNKEEKEAIEYYSNKEISFSCDFNTEELLKALGIEETEKDSFENHQIRFRTLLNLIQKQEKIIDNMAEQLAGLTIWNDNIQEPLILVDKEEVIEYYEKEVEKE